MLSENRRIKHFSGLSGIKELYRAIMKEWRPKDEYLVASAPLQSFDKLENFFVNEVHKKRIQDRVELKILINKDSERFSFVRKQMPHTQVRFLELETEAEYGVLNNFLFIVSYGSRPFGILVKDRGLANTYRSYFHVLWNKGRKITIPAFITKNKSLTDIILEYSKENPLIVTDPYNFPAVESLGTTICVKERGHEIVARIKKLVKESGAGLVIGVGGCTALDAARVGATKKVPAVMIPTILSTVCIGVDKSVFTYKNATKSFQAESPRAVIHSLPVLTRTTQADLVKWSQSGFGDLFAKISAAIDVSFRENKDLGGQITYEQVRRKVPETLDALQWVTKQFRGYTRRTLDKEARFLHDASTSIIIVGGFSLSGGAEHDLGYKMEHMYAKNHKNWPTHGQGVSIGTLVQTKLLSDISGDDRLYSQLQVAYKKLKLPTTYQELKKFNVTKNYIVSGIKAIKRHNTFMSYHWERAIELLDDIFKK
jgi:glycerol dehydrogenase-like iron-containing ADH family enzyme